MTAMEDKASFFEYISLKRASEFSGYHPDYLSYLLRKGKIKGKRIGRDWFTTRAALQNYLLRKKFFSIQEILFSKVNSKKILFSTIAVILILVAAFFIFIPPFSFQEIKGDFSPRTLQTRNIGFLEITTYISDEKGEIEISVKPQPEVLNQAKENSFFQKIKNFFNSYVLFK